MIKLISWKKFMLTKRINHVNYLFQMNVTFLNKNFRFLSRYCNSFHDLMQKPTSFNNVAIVSIKVRNYRICFWYMSRKEAINRKGNANLTRKMI